VSEPAYVKIAGDYARRIRSGEISPGSQLKSYVKIAGENGVSEIVARKAVELLLSQGLVRAERRRGVFVTDRPMLIRVSPERQLEDPEDTYGNESELRIDVTREAEIIRVTAELASAFSLSNDDEILHTVTKAAEDGRPISVSDTYQPIDVRDLSEAFFLEETVTDRIPAETHAVWLQTAPGDLVKQVHQRFITREGRLIMLSDVSYPRDRYDGFMFRMTLSQEGG
jgi:GntR family transcriptional regulator